MKKVLLVSLLFVCIVWSQGIMISVDAQQIPLKTNKIPQFVDPLPTLETLLAPAATGSMELQMKEFRANILPTGFVPPGIVAPATFTGTYVWGYLQPAQTSRLSYLGPVIVTTKGIPTEIKFTNLLGTVNTGNAATDTKVAAYANSTDQTLHWADPLANGGWNSCNILSMEIPGVAPTGSCATNYAGPIPATVHIHGGEVPPGLDGGPDSWFTSGPFPPDYPEVKIGHGYYSKDGPDAKNYAIYRYPNSGEAGPIWFHDHTLGATRLNVYAGLAGGYFIEDPAIIPVGMTTTQGAPGTCTTGCLPANLQPLTEVIPIVIQDRMFDTTGQLFFPAAGINLEHPFWVPEFVGDTIVVNGKTWPYKNVAPKRYRFLVLNGSNARTYELFLINKVTGAKGPSMWVIGTDGGYIDAPREINPNAKLNSKLIIMPGERYEVIIDFGGQAAGTILELRNTAKTPYPNGAPVNGKTTGKIMQFRVNQAFAGPDTSYNPNPATGGGQALRASKPIVRLPGTPLGPTIDKTAGTGNVQEVRQLTLNEVMGPGGPLEVLVNNTKLSGDSTSDGKVPGRPYDDFTPKVYNGFTQLYSELPKEGTTEVWEIINMTADAHPMHLHLVQFQIMNRQTFNMKNYTAAYNAPFPAGVDPMTFLPVGPGVYLPGWGPPLDYNTGNPNALGGNPDITPFLSGAVALPAPHEQGWKDTVVTYPGQVTRIAVRWAPTDKELDDPAQYFPFNPNDPVSLGNTVEHGYVWHCHIVDHEDNEMMRPTLVVPNAAAERTYTRTAGDY